MKKISFLMLLAAFLTLGLTSCVQDTYPRLEKPTEFVLNTPPTANLVYELAENAGINLTCSQPNYGLGVVTTFQVQVSATEDFAEYTTVGDDDKKNPGKYIAFEGCKIEVPGNNFGMAVCRVFGYTNEDNFNNDVRPVYIRLLAYIPGDANSEILSNVIELKQVRPYLAVPQPGKIWLIGDCEGWEISPDPKTWVLTENPEDIGSKIYHGQFDIPAGKAMFRFYTALGDWDGNSIGYQEVDEATEFSFTDGLFTSSAVSGKGAWSFPTWAGGEMKITVNLSNADEMSVQFEAVN